MSGPDQPRVDSIRQRLLNLARQRGEEFQLTLDRYAVERLLYRLSVSPHRDAFVLKGALLFQLWQEQTYRPTRDADFLGFGAPESTRIETVVRELCAMHQDDGLVFDDDSMRVEPIREGANYEGLRMQLRATLGRAQCWVQWDIGFGDAITPGPVEVELPTLIGELPAPSLRAYPRETVFAEKLEALVVLGMANSRMKDYFDLFNLIGEAQMHAGTLASAIAATFARRGTPIPADLPLGLTETFALDALKQGQWHAFLSRNRLQAPGLEEVVKEIARTVGPLWSGAASR